MQVNTTKKYKILDHRITIKYVEKDIIEEDHWIYGHTEWRANNVYIIISIKDDSGKDLTDDEIESTVRHELFHVILGILYFNQERDNETLVEWLAQATKILHKQGLSI